MITMFKRGSVYWVRASFDGKEMRQSLRTRDGQVAQALTRQLELDVLTSGNLTNFKWPQFEAVVTKFCTVHRIDQHPAWNRRNTG